MKRPQDAGRGLDGVVRKSPEYYNPATELLDSSSPSPSPSSSTIPPLRPAKGGRK
jgi:hypothetical protein